MSRTAGYIILVVVAAWLGYPRVGRAAEWLYQPTDQRLVGRVVQGLPGWRIVSSGQRDFLSGSERRRTQPIYRYRQQFTPNDADYVQQWNFPAINLPAAWDAVQPVAPGGDPRVIVAVLDTGLATAAPDLVNLHLWTNPGEVPGDGLDNDHDGFIDDIHGWDFVHGSHTPMDDNGHGTHVTGTIAESTDNSLDDAGIAYNTTIMPLKVINSDGSGTTNLVVPAVRYAVDHGADIINLSFGGTDDDPALHQEIDRAISQGVLVVSAAGNGLHGVGQPTLEFPAAYAGVVAVGATANDNSRAGYSNYGPGLTLMAPGSGIRQESCVTADCSTFSIQTYNGTSQATAHVSGVAALLAACGLPPGQLSQTLIATATNLGTAGYDTDFGYGLVNASAAVNAAGCAVTTPVGPTTLVARAAPSLDNFLSSGRLNNYRQPQFSWTGPAGAVYHVSWAKSGQTPTVTVQTATTFQPTLTADGVYALSIVSVDGLGQSSAPLTFSDRYRRSVVAVAGDGHIRLYDDQFKRLRDLTAPQGFNLSGGRLEADGTNRLVLTQAGRPSIAQILTTTGQLRRTLQPLGSTFRGRLTAAVVERIGADGVLAFAGESTDARIAWYSSSGQLIRRQLIYPTYRSGLALARGDLDGNGVDELIVAQTKGPEVRVYDTQARRLLAMSPLGRGYSGGWKIAAGDFDGDGRDEIIAASAVSRNQRQVFILSGSGTVRQRWTWRVNSTGPVTIGGGPFTGDGYSRMLAASQSLATNIQQWTLGGKKQKQVALTSLTNARIVVLH